MKSIRINKKLPNKEIKLEKDVFYYTDNELIKLLNVTLTKLCKIHLLPVKGTKKMMSSRLIKFKGKYIFLLKCFFFRSSSKNTHLRIINS